MTWINESGAIISSNQMMDAIKDRLARIKESPSQRLARLQQAIPTTTDEIKQGAALEKESRHIRVDPDIQAQMNLSMAMAISRLPAEELAQQSDEEMAVYYKVTDPIHFFLKKADDFRRRPRESDASFERRKITTAKRRCARWLKKYPNHTRGHIDRASTIGWSQRRKKVQKKKKPTEVTKIPRWFRLLPGKKDPSKWTRRELLQAIIIRNQFAVIELLMEQSGIKYTNRKYEALIKKAIKAADRDVG